MAVADLSDDDLIAYGAALEARYHALAAAVEAQVVAATPEWRQLRVSAIKLGVNTTLGVAGAVGATFTFGISLLLTAGSVAMIAWDGIDFARGFGEYQVARHQLQSLRSEMATLETALAMVLTEIERRSHG